MNAINISLPDSMRVFIDEQIKQKGYNPSHQSAIEKITRQISLKESQT